MENSSKLIEKEFKNLRKKLLDLTLRNQLLNFKNQAKTIRVNNQSVSNIFQTLVINNKKMYFQASKKENEEKSKFSIWNHSPIDFSRFTEGDVKLQADLTPTELQKRLFYINNQSKTMLEEQGYNILYIACGFLEWYDNSKPKQKNLAPLILIPVTIERKTVGKSFNLYWTGEDIQTNISLKAKLKENGIILPDFEHKNYAEVIEDYLLKVRKAISHIDKWSVNGDVALGFFSFTKLVMYSDLNPDSWEDNVDLTKNELIEAIFNPSKNSKEAFKEEDIDLKLSYENMYQVLDADSSQIAAIQDVKAGRNLVVEGPPGTGKSQTIVNLIAELLAEGKSVLFVAEKMAALDVVKERLAGVGLSKFVLELHSHKTRRKKFLKELEKATTNRYEEDLKIDQTIRKLETLRMQLDEYANVIHEPLYNVNLSAYQLYGIKESADNHFSKKGTIIPLVRFMNPENITLKDLDDIILQLENLAELYQTISKENPWSKCSPKSLLPSDLREIELLISDTLFALDNFLIEREHVYDIYGIKKPDTLNEFKKSLSALDLIKSKNMELIDGNILKNYPNNTTDAFHLINTLDKYQKVSKILLKFNENIYHVNLNHLISQVQQVSNKKFSFFKRKHNTEIVEPYYATNVPGINQVIDDLINAREAIKLKRELELNKNLAIKYFGEAWHLNAKINDLKGIIKWINDFNILRQSGMVSNDTIHLLSKDLFELNPEDNLSDYINAGDEFNNKLSKLKSKLNPRSKLIFKKDSGDVSFERWKNQLNNWRGQLSSLHLWSQYLNTKTSCKGSYAEDFIDTIEKRNIKKSDVKALVNGNFADSLLNLIFIENQQLVTFIGELHENRITEFKDLDKQILLLNRKRIYQKLSKNIPKIYGATEDPEAKILAGEFTRKSGHLSVRKLLEKAGGTIKQIKPCFMMSPLSVAQYLDPTNEKLQFDVVIFDEASQVKPEDALGAFMRGKTAVVMGDTQQLPPTSFFEQLASGESHEEEATALDMESILHLCKLSFPVKMLKWHYRSRHESLINVSNNQFYDNELLVYPSPSHSDPELGLKLHYNPDTYYQKGTGSKNPLEAKEVVKEIFKHFDKYGDTKSLGVGTFSVAQKNAILEELEIERKNRPELEPLFAENKDERFFVKNLETIQGDERDVILISVGYGFTQEGKMSLNFGPLNQNGGERRLNVLITRAREKCVVFTNFKAHDMHMTNNPPFGVKALAEFLEYAENLTLGTNHHIKTSKYPFEDAVANFLKENGYDVDTQIGCAGFRVDLAIKDPENLGKYFLGITTDGKMYASSKVARDRDRLREQVLTGLGWKLYHLWSTDWYRNRDLARSKLLNEVSDALTKYREEEQRKSDEARKLEEKLKKEALKKAEELRLAREREEEEKAKKLLEAQNIEIVAPIDENLMDDNNHLDINSNIDNISIDGINNNDDVDNLNEEYISFNSDITEDDVSLGGDTIDESTSSSFDNEVVDSLDEGIIDSSDEIIEVVDSLDEGIIDSSDEIIEVVDSLDEDIDKSNNEEIDYSDDKKEDNLNKSIFSKINLKSIKSKLKPTFINNLNKNINDNLEEDNINNDESIDSINELNNSSTDDNLEEDNSNDDGNSDSINKLNNNSTDDNLEEAINNDGSNDLINELNNSSTDDNLEEAINNDGSSDSINKLNNISSTDDNLEEAINNDGSSDSINELNNNSTDDNLEEDNVDDKNESNDNILENNEDNNSIDIPNNINKDNEIKDIENNNQNNELNNTFKDNIKFNDTSIEKNNNHNNDEPFTKEEIFEEFKIEETIEVDHQAHNNIPDINENKSDNSNKNDEIIIDHESRDKIPDIENNEDFYIKDYAYKENDNKITNSNNENDSSQEVVSNSKDINSNKEKKHGFINSMINNLKEGESKLEPKRDANGNIIYKTELLKEDITEISDETEIQEVEIDLEDGRSIIKKEMINIDLDNDDITLNDSYYTDVKFKTTINFDEDDNMDEKYSEEEKEYYESQEDYYKGVEDINNPLKKNNIHKTENKKGHKSVIETLSGLKNNVQYINKSLKEIENPTPAEYIHVIDRTKKEERETEFSEDDSDLIIKMEEESKKNKYETHQVSQEESPTLEINNDLNIQNNDENLENIIIDADKSYKEIEKERFRENNKLKEFDDKKLPKKMDYIIDYKQASDFGIETTNDIYEKPLDDVANSIYKIVQIEGPIHIDELIKRIKDSCEISRAGVKFKDSISTAVDHGEEMGSILKIGDFLFDATSKDINIRKRVKPNIDYISDEEIAKNIEHVLIEKSEIPAKDLTKKTARNFGFRSTSRKTANRINIILDRMILDGKVVMNKDIVELK